MGLHGHRFFGSPGVFALQHVRSDVPKRRLQGLPPGSFVIRQTKNPEAHAALTVNGPQGAMSYHVFQDGSGL